ncbi:ABC transporter permease [Longirhabdus pacifica]|uniref:ABC transporter permease n=1 Tax=Longirhabdus pacifica TaxID=2305227 RepID=UPI0010092937|nr:ABC transporter permease [Longirhabdus pacifica]
MNRYNDVRRQRSIHFWKQVLPYVKYVVSSGFLFFCAIFAFLFFYYYSDLVNHYPADFPLALVATAVLFPFICFNSIRTFFVQADIIFLVPAESKLKEYIQTSIRKAFYAKIPYIFVLWFFIWPLYRMSLDINHLAMFLVVFLFLLLLLFFNIFSHWQELQMINRIVVKGFTFLRWVLCIASLYLLFSIQWPLAICISGIAMIAYVFMLHKADKHILFWENLIRVESKQRSRFELFLNAFVDYPRSTSGKSNTFTIKLKKMQNLFPFKKKQTFHYFYFLMFLRNEWFGIVLRLNILAILIGLLMESQEAAMALQVFFVYIIGVQLSSLPYVHRYAPLLNLLPLQQKMRANAAANVAAVVHVLSIVLLSIPILTRFPSYWMVGIACVEVIVSFIYFRHVNTRKWITD